MGGTGRRRLVDLSHEVADGMAPYPGLPPPAVRPLKARTETAAWYTDGSAFEITRVDLVTAVATYLHAPWHRYAEGADLAGLALEQVADLPGLRVEARNRPGRAIGRNLLDGVDACGKAVLFHTGWASRWGTPGYWEPGPYLSAEGCAWLIGQGVVLEALPPAGFRVHAVPTKFRRCDSFPVRAYAVMDGGR